MRRNGSNHARDVGREGVTVGAWLDNPSLFAIGDVLTDVQ
jgi:hypothetical protein